MDRGIDRVRDGLNRAVAHHEETSAGVRAAENRNSPAAVRSSSVKVIFVLHWLPRRAAAATQRRIGVASPANRIVIVTLVHALIVTQISQVAGKRCRVVVLRLQ